MSKQKLAYIYLFFDLTAAALTWSVFIFFRKIVNEGLAFESLSMLFPNFNFYGSLFIFPLCSLFFFIMSGFYLKPVRLSLSQVFFNTFLTTFITSVVVFFILLLDDIVTSYQYYYYSLCALFCLLFVSTLLFRTAITLLIRHKCKTKNSKWKINTLILGTGRNAVKAQYELKKRAPYNHFTGYVRIDCSDESKNATPVLGGIADLNRIVTNTKAEEIVIAVENITDQQLYRLINRLFKCNINIRIVPNLYERFSGNIKMPDFKQNPFACLSEPSISEWESCVKRFGDILFSALALALICPLIGVFAVLIKKENNGSVFYLQERIGKNGRAFNIVKLRTMYADAEKETPQLSSPTDARVTKIGTFLRKYRLDEIPQFWNVIKGDMSLVGPRPERQYYIDKITAKAPYYCLLYKIRPGLTSWGPIKIGYADTLDKMIERLNYDLLYMNNMSLPNDLKILILTVEIIFKGKGI
ncbi:MAG: sugar transferase [Prevotellaceae bacterium]|jgi:exopolysaccharide biosynthesis polyprenyl glycosylphosphotransferase|nr:sugar transferase [Prevotellaceae bacterium]